MDDVFGFYAREVLPHASLGIRMRDSSCDLWLQRMMGAFGDVRGKAILDFGSGSGHKALLLALLGARVTALEVDPAQAEAIRRASERTGAGLRVLHGDQGLLPTLPDAGFDGALASEVIEHLPPEDAAGFCRELARLLRPGGRLFLTTPNRVAYGPAETSKEHHSRQPFGHHKHYTERELRELLGRVGFRVLSCVFETHPLTLWRNRLFYPMARLDYCSATPGRLPWVRRLLRPAGAVAHAAWESAYPLVRRLHHAYERRRERQERTGITLMLAAERTALPPN
jgi:SAM-dependent methyltransferase